MAEAGLQVQRHGIVDRAPDPLALEVRVQLVPALAASEVPITPPSPHAPRFLLGKKENPAARPSSPTIRHWPSIERRAPIACAASSMIGRSRARPMAPRRSMAAIWP